MSFICSKNIYHYISCISLNEWAANSQTYNHSSMLSLAKANPLLRMPLSNTDISNSIPSKHTKGLPSKLTLSKPIKALLSNTSTTLLLSKTIINSLRKWASRCHHHRRCQSREPIRRGER